MARGYPNPITLLNAAGAVPWYTGFVAERNGDIVGFSAGYVSTAGEVISVPYPEVAKYVSFTAKEVAAYLDIVCVAEEHEGKGVGSELAETVAQQLENWSKTIITEVWHRNRVDGTVIVEKLGFEQATADEDYWQISTRGYGTCPECDSSPCHCRGSLHVRF